MEMKSLNYLKGAGFKYIFLNFTIRTLFYLTTTQFGIIYHYEYKHYLWKIESVPCNPGIVVISKSK